MAKHKSSVIATASGKMTNIWLELSAAVARHGGTDEHVLALDTPFGRQLVDRFAQDIMYQEWRRLIDACGITRIHFISMDRYPLEPVSEDENDWEVCIHRFSEKQIGGKEALERLEKLGYRFLHGLRRGLRFLATEPRVPEWKKTKPGEPPLASYVLTTMCPVYDHELIEIDREIMGPGIIIGRSRINRLFFPTTSWVVLRRRQ